MATETLCTPELPEYYQSGSILNRADCRFYGGFVTDQSTIFEELQEEIPWHQTTITVFGYTGPEPRLGCYIGSPGTEYLYSNTVRQPLDWSFVPECLSELRDNLSALVRSIKPDHPPFNAVLCNYYRDGKDKIGKHSDDETGMIPGAFIASVSLGETRFFDITDKTLKTKQRLTLTGGDLLLMGENMQVRYTHEVPQQIYQYTIENGKKKRSRKTGPRINLTFRCIAV